jgi:hypothetical protein
MNPESLTMSCCPYDGYTTNDKSPGKNAPDRKDIAIHEITPLVERVCGWHEKLGCPSTTYHHALNYNILLSSAIWEGEEAGTATGCTDCANPEGNGALVDKLVLSPSICLESIT